jgi:hypothetical protein
MLAFIVAVNQVTHRLFLSAVSAEELDRTKMDQRRRIEVPQAES